MATTNFNLKPENKEGFSQVILVYRDRGKKFKISTYKTKSQKSKRKSKVTPACWSDVVYVIDIHHI